MGIEGRMKGGVELLCLQDCNFLPGQPYRFGKSSVSRKEIIHPGLHSMQQCEAGDKKRLQAMFGYQPHQSSHCCRAKLQLAMVYLLEYVCSRVVKVKVALRVGRKAGEHNRRI